MSSYAERIDDFAEGKRLARMSRPIRNRADAWCDACGSVQARVLFGVKDEHTERVYFVGEHCLQQLAERGALVRRFCKQSAEDAYAARFDHKRWTNSPTVDESPAERVPTSGVGLPDPVGTDNLVAYLVIAAQDAQPGARAQIVPLRVDGNSADSVLRLLRQWSGGDGAIDAPAARSSATDHVAVPDRSGSPVPPSDGTGVAGAQADQYFTTSVQHVPAPKRRAAARANGS
jgi:hypothetical protein